MKTWFGILALTLAAGCTTSEDVRNEPARFSVRVPAAWDRVAVCLKRSYIDSYSIVDLADPAHRKVEIVLYAAGGSTKVAVAIFDLQGSDSGTQVTWRRAKMIINEGYREDRTREYVAYCGAPTR